MENKEKRYQIFIDEYLRTNNATTAAIRAGYAKDSAATQGWKLLQKKDIQSEIERKRTKSAASASSRRILNASEIKEQLTIEALNADNPASVRTRALEILAKINGLMIERIEERTELTADILRSASMDDLMRMLRTDSGSIAQNGDMD